jgi:hypothetical protein
MNNIENTAREFIRHSLDKFIVLFPQTRVRYEYDELSNIHTVEIVPNNVYHLDEVYIAWENNFTDKFIEKFPNQNICFLSDDALAGLESIHYELIGSKYEDLISFIDSLIFNNPEIFINTNLSFEFDVISTNQETINSENIQFEKYFSSTTKSANSVKSVNPQIIENVEINNNYPLAA